MKTGINILTIDGGGLRGILPLLILKELEKIVNKPIINQFHLIAGTSTGAIIAVGLSHARNHQSTHYSISDLEHLYVSHGAQIFPPTNNWIDKNWKQARSLFSAEYSNKGLLMVLNKYFDHYRINSCMVPILVPAYDIRNNCGVFFKSRYAHHSSIGYSPLKNALLTDICMATSAGPTYLASHRFNYCNEEGTDAREINCIDGGVFLNNPTMAALVEIWKYYKDPVYGFNNYNELPPIRVLSIGTGHYNPDWNTVKTVNWGKMQWARPLIELMMWSGNQAVVAQAREALLLNENKEDVDLTNHLLRINVSLDKPIDMADSSLSAINYLYDTFNSQVKNNPAIIKELELFARYLYL